MIRSILSGCIIFTAILSYAQEVADYEITSYRISLSKATDEAINAINSHEGKENIPFIFDQTCSQEDFARACEAFPWMKQLEVAYGNELINDISPMKDMKNLESVIFKSLKSSKEKPLNLEALKQSAGLTKLDFYATKVSNTDALANLKKLEDVSFYMSGIESIDFVKGTPQLTKLNLYGFGHTFKNYEPLTSLSQLTELDIYMNPQATDENLKVLEKLTTLTKIAMSNNKVATSLDFLKNCKDMMEIRASWCEKLADFSALEGMEKLKMLEVSGSRLTSIDFLKGNRWITVLDISDTKVTDLSPLKDCTSINTLKVSGLPVDDVLFVKEYPNMWSLEVPSSISDAQITSIKEVHPNLRISVRD